MQTTPTTPRPVPDQAAPAPQHSPAFEAERDRVIQTLAAHYAYDRLSLEEFEERLERAYRVVSVGQLAPLLADLPSTTAEELAAAPQAVRVPAAGVPERGFAMAVMGGFERKGGWVVPRRFKVTAIMGGGVLDLREARFGPGVTEIDVFVFMGGVEVYVPPGVRVECSGAALMGGFGTDTGDVGTFSPMQPVVRLSGMAVWGAVDAQTRLPGESEKQYKRRRKEEERRRRGG